jgi:hypothetical protein
LSLVLSPPTTFYQECDHQVILTTTVSDSRILPEPVPAGCPRKKQYNAKAKDVNY